MMNAEFVTLYGAESAVGFFLSLDEALECARPQEAVRTYAAIRCQHVAGKHTGLWEYYLLSDRERVPVGKEALENYYDRLREQVLQKLSDAELRSLGLKLDSEGCLVRI